MLLLALGQPDFDLGKAPFGEIDAERDDRQPLLLGLNQELIDLLAMEQEFPSTERLMIRKVAVAIRTDVAMVEKDLSLSHTGITVLQVHAPISQGLDLRALEHDARFELFLYEIVVVGFAVGGDGFFTFLFLLLHHWAASPRKSQRLQVQKSSGLRRLLT
jgi:hypothetical protein